MEWKRESDNGVPLRFVDKYKCKDGWILRRFCLAAFSQHRYRLWGKLKLI